MFHRVELSVPMVSTFPHVGESPTRNDAHDLHYYIIAPISCLTAWTLSQMRQRNRQPIPCRETNIDFVARTLYYLRVAADVSALVEPTVSGSR